MAIALMYVPGYLFWRGMGFSRLLALCSAPLFSIAIYSLLPIAYFDLGVSCSAYTVALPALLVGCLAYGTRRRLVARPIRLPSLGPVRPFGRSMDFDLVCFLIALAMGVAVCLWVFVSNLPSPDAFYSRFDNQTHVNLPQAFLESGRWSTLHASTFLASPTNQTPFANNTGGFYPAAWHVLVALVCSCAHAVVTVSTNALVAVICGVTFPTSLLLLIRVLLEDNRRAILLGSLLVCASAVLPWVFLIKGPTYPEMISHSLVPTVLAVIVLCVEKGFVPDHKLAFSTFCLLSFAGLAIMHPNSVFTCYVFLAAFGLHMVWKWTSALSPVPRGACCALFVCAVVGVWVGCYQLPLLQGVLAYHWSTVNSVFSSVASLGTLSLSIGREQPVLIVSVLVGGVLCLRRKWFWVLFPPMFFAVCFMVSRLGMEEAKYWLAALWYMTPYRFSSKIIIFSLPVMALGLDCIVGGIQWLVSTKAPQTLRRHSKAVCAMLFCLLFVYNYAPLTFYDASFLYPEKGDQEHPCEASFGRVRRRIYNIYTSEIEHVYSNEEIAFVNSAIELIPEDALVINAPNDGSMWSYGVNDLKTFYRSRGYGSDTPESVLIRTDLASYATSDEVQDAIRSTEAQYVLQLDHGEGFADGEWIPQFGEGQMSAWKGIDAVDENTPGFELVLSEGDEMRLYRILEE